MIRKTLYLMYLVWYNLLMLMIKPYELKKKQQQDQPENQSLFRHFNMINMTW